MLTPTYQAIKHQVQSASLIHADETRHQRGGERHWMWMALSKIAVCFMTAYGRGQDAAERLLGTELDGVLVTDQYAGYRFIDKAQRQLCWAHVLRNVAAIAHRAVRRLTSPSAPCWSGWLTVFFVLATALKMATSARSTICAGSGAIGRAG